VFVRLTLELEVVQLYVPPEGVPVAARVVEFGPDEPPVTMGTYADPEMLTVGVVLPLDAGA